MDELQGLCGSVGGKFGNRASVLLASQAGFANWVR